MKKSVEPMTWRELNHKLATYTEAEVKALLDYECANDKRISTIERLHQRYNVLRVSRERIELLSAAGGPKPRS